MIIGAYLKKLLYALHAGQGLGYKDNHVSRYSVLYFC